MIKNNETEVNSLLLFLAEETDRDYNYLLRLLADHFGVPTSAYFYQLSLILTWKHGENCLIIVCEQHSFAFTKTKTGINYCSGQFVTAQDLIDTITNLRNNYEYSRKYVKNY